MSAVMTTKEHLLKWLRHKVVFPALALLPSALGYRLANLIGRLDARRHGLRLAVGQGMSALFPDLAQDPLRLQTLLLNYYQMMARDMLDCFLMPGFTPAKVAGQIRVHGVENLLDAKAAGRGVLMIISHFGRFFMLGPGLKFAGVEFGMFTTMVDERHPHYDAIDRWYIATKLQNTQLFSRGTWVTTGDDGRRLYRTLQAGEIMLFALDGNESTSGARVEFPFCGGTLSLPEGLVRVAAKTGAKLVYAEAVDRGIEVDITLHPLPDDPVDGVAAAVGLLEKRLAAVPWQWWQWAGVGALWRPAVVGAAGESQCT